MLSGNRLAPRLTRAVTAADSGPGAPVFDAAVDQGRDAGRIIAPIFQASKSFEKPGGHRIPGDDAR